MTTTIERGGRGTPPSMGAIATILLLVASGLLAGCGVDKQLVGNAGTAIDKQAELAELKLNECKTALAAQPPAADPVPACAEVAERLGKVRVLAADLVNLGK